MSLNFRRILTPDAMRFQLHTQLMPPTDDFPEDFDPMGRRNIERIREDIIGELCELFEASGAASNRNRLFKDLFNREKKAGTALAEGIAVPHVRTMQAKTFAMAFGRSRRALPFLAADDEPLMVHFFFAMIAPPYDDKPYLKVYKTLGSTLSQREYREYLMEAEEPNEVWRVLETVR